MAEVENFGEKEEEAEEEARTNFILMTVSVVLMFVPIVGQELAVASGMATLARAIIIAGEAANGALAVYDSVSIPSSAILITVRMLMGVGGIAKVPRDARGSTKVSNVVKTMSPDVVGQFGTIFAYKTGDLAHVMRFCRY